MNCPVCSMECDELIDLKPFNDHKVCPACLKQVRQGIDTVLYVRSTYLNANGGNAQHS